jgi:hypothetical protein
MSDAISKAIEALRMTKYCIPAYGFHAEKVTIDEAIAGLQALQNGEPVVNEPTFIDLTLEEIEGIIKSNITITDYRLYDGVYAVATDIETALKNKNSSAGKGGELDEPIPNILG